MRTLIVTAVVLGSWGGGAAWASPPEEDSQRVFVPADQPAPVSTPLPLEEGRCYLLTARGVFGVWTTHREGVDAYYGYARWRWGPTPVLVGGLLVDGTPMHELARAWGDSLAYRKDHVYTTHVLGRGRRLELQTGDARNGSWPDNSGGLEVLLRPCPLDPA